MMSAVPKNRSGMGSAMNDTTREFGGALGIAVLGSMVSSGYSKNIHEVISNFPSQIPSEALSFAESSLAGALVVSESMGDSALSFSYAAKESFMAGNSSAMVISAIIAFIASILMVFFLPNQTKDLSINTELSQNTETTH
jgi:hypothetical protein